MDWKEDPHKLALKIRDRLEKEKTDVTYTELAQIAEDKDIDIDIFDMALTKLHNSKKVKKRVKGGDIVYTAVPRPKKKEIKGKECLVQITLISSPYFEAQIYPLSDFKREDDTLYRLGAVVTPGYGENRIWFKPTDIGLPNDDLPLPAHAIKAPMPFPEIDYSHIFLRPEEMKQFKADMKGIPLFMVKKYKTKKK